GARGSGHRGRGHRGGQLHGPQALQLSPSRAARAARAPRAPRAGGMTGGNAVVFGGSGAIGAVVAADLERAGFVTYRTSRQGAGGGSELDIALDPFDGTDRWKAAIDALPAVDAVVWAQGTNANDSLVDLDL